MITDIVIEHRSVINTTMFTKPMDMCPIITSMIHMKIYHQNGYSLTEMFWSQCKRFFSFLFEGGGQNFNIFIGECHYSLWERPFYLFVSFYFCRFGVYIIFLSLSKLFLNVQYCPWTGKKLLCIWPLNIYLLSNI